MMFYTFYKNSIVEDSRGYSLIEILVTLAIVGFIMAAVYGIYLTNLRAVYVEEERVELQQDQRIAVDFLAKELRLAGYDKEESLLPTIVDARSNFIYFTADRNNDGVLNADREHVAFCLFNSQTYGRSLSYISGTSSDVGQVGSVVGSGAVSIAHTHPNHQHETLATVQEIEFFYTLEDGTQTTTPASGQMEDIRSVEVSILSRADNSDPRWQDTQTYTTASGTVWGPYNDTTRRRMITASIRFRNMGLN